MTRNMQVLALTLALFGTVTSAQTIGAIIAHSEAMLADSCAMWVDCMTYMLNIFAEASAGKWFSQALPSCHTCYILDDTDLRNYNCPS